MKKKIMSIFILLFLLGCFPEFDEVRKYIVLDGEQEKIDLINGIYSRLVRVHNKNYFKLCCRSDDVNVYNNYSYSPLANTEFDWPANANGCLSRGSNIPLSSSMVNEVYANLYKAIIVANTLICELSVDDDSVLLGETYFLRAYCFFKLARFFGTPPLVIDNEVKFKLEKPTYAEVYQLIEEDLLIAADLLPSSYSNSRIPGETPHVGVAKALLAEVYLSMAGFPLNDKSKYPEAARLAKEVIDNAGIYNVELIPDIAKLCVKPDEHCNEHLFSLFNKSKVENTNGTISDIKVSFDLNSVVISNSGYRPQFKFYTNFPKNYRKNTFIKTGSYCTSAQHSLDSTIEILNFSLLDPLSDPCIYIGEVAYMKYLYIEDYMAGGEKQHVNIYLLRFAQTLLTYAEAKARSGDIDQTAYEAVNMIRRRANKQDIYSPSEFDLPMNLSPEQFIDSVVWERAWELCFEPDGRWFDIVRLDMKDQLNSLRYSFDSPNIVSPNMVTDEWYYYRIPEEELWSDSTLNAF